MKSKSIWELLAAGESVSEKYGEKAEEPPVENSELLELRKAYKRANILSTVGFGLAALSIGALGLSYFSYRAAKSAENAVLQIETTQKSAVSSKASETNVASPNYDGKIAALEVKLADSESRFKKLESEINTPKESPVIDDLVKLEDELVHRDEKHIYDSIRELPDMYFKNAGHVNKQVRILDNHIVYINIDLPHTTSNNEEITNTIPANIHQLTHLKELEIGNSRINKIEFYGIMPSLVELNLADNEITKIEGLDKTPNVKYLDLSKNKIKKIEGLDVLKNLMKVDLSGNELDYKNAATIKAVKELESRGVEVIYTPPEPTQPEPTEAYRALQRK